LDNKRTVPNIILSDAVHPYVTISPDSPEESLDTVQDDQITDLYKQHGAILFRGYSLGTGQFRAFADRFCTGSILNDAVGREIVDQKNNIQSVNLGSDSFPLHPELSLVPWKPDVCFFACLNPPGRGGETTICDGTVLVERMPDNVFDAFAPRRLMYVRSISPDQLRYWVGASEPDDHALSHPAENCPFTFIRSTSGINRIFTAPALHKPMFLDKLAFGNFLLFARFMLKLTNFPLFENGEPVPQDLLETVKRIGDELATPITWRSNDMLMLDNSRFMHGRNAISDVAERRIVSYFGYLRFAMPGPEEPLNAAWRRPGFSELYV
jgi:hypothetical protein